MKNLNIIALILISLCCQNYIQAQKTKKITIYRSWIFLNNQPSKMEGALYEIRDSSILLSNSVDQEDYINYNFEVVDLPFHQIEMIQVRKMKNIAKGTLIGAAVGVAVGTIAGFSSGDDPEGFLSVKAETKAILGASIGGVTGGFFGAMIGASRITFQIKGNKYRVDKAELRKYAILKN